MKDYKVRLDLDGLSIDSFSTDAFDVTGGANAQSVYQQTVLDHTEAYSCGGTCGTCGGTDCYA